MAASHTPGRWYWAEDADGNPIALMASPGGRYVATPQDHSGLYVDVSEADAKLIEVAPDLLDVLRVIAAGDCDIEAARRLALMAIRRTREPTRRFEAATP